MENNLSQFPHIRLAIAVPWTTEMAWTRSWKSIARLCCNPPPDTTIEVFGGPELGDGWCAARRHNACLEHAILWNADLILILGADQKYQPDMLKKLVARHREGCDVVAGNVPIRGHVANQGTKPFQPICWRVKPDQDGNMILTTSTTREDVEFVGPEHGDIVQINGCGSGVLMFPASALKHIQAPWFTEEPVYPTFSRKACADWPFVGRLQKEAHLKIWCDTTIKVTHIHPFEIDDTFSERFKDWAANPGDPSCCEPEDPDNGKIRQVRVSPSIPFYKDKFIERYKLEDYSTPFLPSFFFGCYTKEDYKAILEHKGIAVIIWAGTDAQVMREHVKNPEGGAKLFPPRVRHIAISRYIEDDLRAVGLPFVSVPLCCIDEKLFQPEAPTGNGIYVYLPKHDREKYGGSLIDELKARLPNREWFINDGLRYKPEDMPKIYRRCITAVRATKHDGLSNTVVEMGLMGRKVLWNGGTPNAIPFDSVEGAAQAIETLIDSQPDYQSVSASMRKYLATGGEAWKRVEYYTPGFKTMTPEVAEQPYDYQRYFNFRYGQGERGAGGPEPASEEAWKTREFVLDRLNESHVDSVVEIGCGSMVRWGAPCRDNYTGIDVSGVAIEQARKRFPEHTFIRRNVVEEDIPQADAIVCIDMFQHITPSDAPELLRKMIDAARKCVIIKTSVNIPTLYYQFNHEWGTLKTVATDTEFSEHPVPGAPHARFFLFEKRTSPSAGEGRGRCCAAEPVPGPSFCCKENAAC